MVLFINIVDISVSFKLSHIIPDCMCSHGKQIFTNAHSVNPPWIVSLKLYSKCWIASTNCLSFLAVWTSVCYVLLVSMKSQLLINRSYNLLHCIMIFYANTEQKISNSISTQKSSKQHMQQDPHKKCCLF